MGQKVSGCVINNCDQPVCYSISTTLLNITSKEEGYRVSARLKADISRIQLSATVGGEYENRKVFQGQKIKCCVIVSPGHRSQVGLIDLEENDVFNLWIGSKDQVLKGLLYDVPVRGQAKNVRFQITKRYTTVSITQELPNQTQKKIFPMVVCPVYGHVLQKYSVEGKRYEQNAFCSKCGAYLKQESTCFLKLTECDNIFSWYGVAATCCIWLIPMAIANTYRLCFYKPQEFWKCRCNYVLCNFCMRQ